MFIFILISPDSYFFESIDTNSNNPSLSPKDSMAEMTAFYNGLVMPSFVYLKDENCKVAEAFDASKNPEVFSFPFGL